MKSGAGNSDVRRRWEGVVGISYIIGTASHVRNTQLGCGPDQGPS